MALKKIEDEAIVEDNETPVEDESTATTDRLIQATHIVSTKFGLDKSYQVTKFNDKVKSIDITLENQDFVVSATIKNAELYMY